MNVFKISNLRNIVFWGETHHFDVEIRTLEKAGCFNVFTADTLEEFQRIFSSHIVHLIVLDSVEGFDATKAFLKHFYRMELASIPMLLAMENEMVKERCDYFNLGVSRFYIKGNANYFLDTLNRIDRDMTFREGLKSMSIAVLDDDRLQLAVIRDMLHRNQILNADFFSNPKELLQSNTQYDIYLIDLILPEVDGEIVILEMRKKYENAVIIGISSIEKQETIARVLSIGANDYIAKPVNEAVFLAKLYTNSRVLMLLKENDIKKKMLQELAIKDGLTSLYNHKHIHEILDANVNMANRYSRPLSLIMLDIDNFKSVNDTYGHPFGDVVLSKVAELIKVTARTSDIVGRYGGEEFIIILPETEGFEAFVLGERIRQKVSDYVFDNGINITISGGASQLITSGEQLIEDADKLLYKAKRTGKNKIEFISVCEPEEESYLSS